MGDLHANNVDTSNMVRTDRTTTLVFVKLSDGHNSYSFSDENSAVRMIAPQELPATVPSSINESIAQVSRMPLGAMAVPFMSYLAGMIFRRSVLARPSILLRHRMADVWRGTMFRSKIVISDIVVENRRVDR